MSVAATYAFLIPYTSAVLCVFHFALLARQTNYPFYAPALPTAQVCARVL